MPRARLDRRALHAARIAPGAPLCLRADAWGSEVELPEAAPEEPEIWDGVALVKVCGPLATEPDTLCGFYDGYEGPHGIAARFAQAHADSNARAVVLYLDSPGGTSSGLFACLRKMQEVRAASGKPTIGFVKQACSAGYCLAMACSSLFGDEDSDAGSIGSYIPHGDESGALAKEGISITLVADPPGKTAGNPYQPLSEVALARMTRDVADCTARFFSAVSTARPALTPDVLRALDGDILQGRAAVNAGLLDGLADLEDVAALARALAPSLAPEVA